MTLIRVAKAQPTPGDAHVNKPLTNISIAFVQRGGWIADQVFPVVPVENQSDLYYTFSQNDFWRDEAKVRAPATESAGGGFGLSTTAYRCVVEAYHKDVDDQLRANADSVLALDLAATEFVTQKLMIRRERRWAQSFFATGIWGTDITPATLWSAAGGDPLADVELGKVAIALNTGFVPNTMVIGYQVLSALRNNAKVRDQFKYTSAESINEAMLARYFGIDRLVVMQNVYASNNEGAAAVNAFIGGKSALLCYSTPSASVMTPTAGYTFAWRGLVGSSGGMRMKRFRMENLESDRIEGQMAYDQKVIAPAMGYFLNGVVA